MYSVIHTLFQFPFVGIYPSVDIYSIFCFEPVPNTSLRVCRLLKVCSYSILSDESKETVAIRTGSAAYKAFKTVKSTVFSIIHQFISDSRIRLMGSGIRADLTNPRLSNLLNGFLTESGPTGIFEATDHVAVDSLLLFMGSIVEGYCSL